MRMLTNVICSFVPKNTLVLKLMSWKHSFKRLNEEYEIATKKKHALDNLFETGRISQSTRDSFNNEIVTAIEEIEKQQKDLLAKMQLKIQALESQIKTLETLLANYEIQHVVGEIDEDIYQHEMAILSTGLDTAKHELDMIIDATNQLCAPPAPVAVPSLPQEGEVAPAVEVPPVEPAPAAPAEVEVVTEPCPQEPAMPIEETAVAPEPIAVAAEEAAPVETAPVEIAPVEAAPVEPTPVETTEVAPAEAPEVTEEITQEPVETVEEAAPAPEQPPLETEEAAPVEAAPAESTEAPPVETAEATEDAPQEPSITIEETIPEQPSEENIEEAPAEIADPVEITAAIPEEPAITIEEAVIEQPSEESEEVLLTEEPQLVEDIPQALEEVAHTANPRNAPPEAHREVVDEPMAEHAEEEAADSSEDQEET